MNLPDRPLLTVDGPSPAHAGIQITSTHFRLGQTLAKASAKKFFDMTHTTLQSRRRCGLPLQLMMLLLLSLLGTAQAWAGSCSGGGSTYTLTMPASVAVPRDTPAGTQLTGWFTQTLSNVYNCSGDPNEYLGTAAQPYSLTNTGATWSSGGLTHTLYATGVPGVGLAIEVIDGETACISYGGEWGTWSAVNPSGGPTGQGYPPAGWTGGSCFVSVPFSTTNSQMVRFTLVSTGAITPGTTTAGIKTQTRAYSDRMGLLASPIYIQTTATVVTVASCTVTDIDVPLGTHLRSEFTGVNTKVGITDFTINVNSCPAGMNTVRYRLELAAGVPAFNAASGIVKLDAASTATGVAVQVMNRSNVAYNFSTMPWTNVTPTYAPATGGNYTIQLRAAYYQTAATVTTGPANSAVMFTMEYR